MQVIIAGSRTFADYARLENTLNRLVKPEDILILGGAKGADALALKWATTQGQTFKVMLADWAKNGKRAGMLRNGEMAKAAEALIVFWDGASAGTLNMIQRMVKLGKPVTIFIY